MDPQHAPWRPLATAELDWAPEDTPRSRRYGDIYFSPEDGPAESRHVFLDGNDLPKRWQHHPAPQFRIGELGFGTGLNFLVTLEALRREAPRELRLHYWAVEVSPLTAADLARCAGALPPELAAPAAALAAQYPPPVPGVHRLLFDEGRVVLDLCWGEAAGALAELASHGRRWFDAWYLDGFAPAANPALWASTLWPTLAQLSRPGATVGTFTAAGKVRRGLAAAGFTMAKRPGFGSKRESLRGSLSVAPATAAPGNTPWDLPAKVPNAPASALVIGAGIAGACAAAALARRGVAVSVLEAGPVAGRGSGNAQGVLFTRLSHRHAPLTDIALLGYLDAARCYRALFDSGRLRPGEDGELAGCFQMAGPKVRLDQLGPALAAIPELAEVLDPASAAQRLGITPAAGGLWLPHSGWLHPAAACRALLACTGITLLEHCGEITLAANDDGWVATAGDGRRWSAEVAVVAAGVASTRLAGLDWLPLKPIRGQVSGLPAEALPATLRAPFCHSGYVTPPREGTLNFGASFVPGDADRSLREADHRHNLDALAAAVPAWAPALRTLDPATIAGRAELRCGTPDYLPLAGPVPAPGAFRECYGPLAKNARAQVPARAPCLPGLYLSTGHGSRGLSSAPLAAELIASQVCDEPPPLPRALARALAPARFLLRDLQRAGVVR
ncbi:bifunctional tRNA (5-methylaminomethyl-2-thiouridine)(34)-methyltransferase MnmD/FAD-dependent 5-carboxymethylaminomethyl-2-thiouridine(34) oxidoreductase MnmC [Pseudohaliea rubra]|uniref:tRNA 5-methylaminomethyl-2-thiouridine biosynthesis bifunctional protein MnmC n=1 Tax=Pseudohaliea rubra DSM 19751 TaxID=1265313 RepID=A0A095VUK5_9GAMM|nr:bifunctional tRNA (5-methylaminomethyl-2-thiouridine)(34)-methyltransferase MnmD/FAD-dependent 5-carboxymethylaminomethyl-2-thiouridine(34) oxidoreductase MnmC [Pseudohaliea rubra]KGE05097.1 tRNA-methyltransferase/ FAD-dependent cmnm(5)s(2)U34 oxidoreductase [Pseudohaliea rubra DSM 19751]